MSSGAKQFSSSASGEQQRVYTGRQIDFFKSSSRVVNIEHGTWTYSSTAWVEGIKSVSGLFTASLNYASRGDNWALADYTLSVVPVSWTFEVTTNARTYKKSGTGNRASIDVTFDEIEQVRGMTFKFEYPSIKTVDFSSWGNANAAFLWSFSSTTIRLISADATAEYQDGVISGINEGNQLQAQTNGLLNTVISGISETINSITALPGKIADAIKGLFVPSQEDLTAIKDHYNQLLSSRFGFVYQAGDMVTGFFTDFSSALQSEDEYEFVFPGIAFPMNGETIVICEEMPVDLDNDVMAALRPVLGTIITIISVLGFINVASDMLEAMISGKSYHDFLHRKDDDG